jgi:drug/metabolite transporter (DMT)-like permease
MERLDNSPEKSPEQNGFNKRPEEMLTADGILRTVTQDLRSLQQELLTQFNQDISRLQAEKSRLVNDIEKLQQQQQALQSQHEITLSQQQIAQQQAWAKQLALVLANHLQTALNERLNQSLGSYQGNLPQIGGNQNYQMMASLDDTVNRTFASLRHDINSYQSSLAQQLERMHTLGQQGEAILEVLVKRLSQQLQVEARQQSRPLLETDSPKEISLSANVALTPPELRFSLGSRPTVPPTPSVPLSSAAAPTSSWTDALTTPAADLNTTAIEDLERSQIEAPETDGSRLIRPRGPVNLKLGLGLVLLSTVIMSLHYVSVGVIGNASQLFGQQSIGGYLNLSHFSNAALLLWIRMLIVVPAMLGLAVYLHPPTLREVRAFSRAHDRRILWGVIGSGVFLFLSQVLLYIAIGQMGSGVAIAVLFIYPVGSLLFGWLLFAEKITVTRLGIIVAILLGALLSLYPLLMLSAPPFSSMIAGLLAAVMFTCYLVAMQIGARKVHPIPVSLIQFATMFVLSSISLIALGIHQEPTSWSHLMIGGVVLALLTIGSYALNHFGIRAVGAARSATIAASTPVLTALLAFFLVPGTLTTLKFIQIVGILLVTMGGTALSLERLVLQNKAARQRVREERTKD